MTAEIFREFSMHESRCGPGRRSGPMIIAFLLAVASPAGADDTDLLAESRAVTRQFATEMQAALQEAMASGGPVSAIGVCKEVAPAIAARMSEETGAVVSRTSRKVRNPANTPEPWQVAILDAFQRGDADNEVFERYGTNGARYMKIIRTGAICLNCHGAELAPDVRQALDSFYPDDQARGYSLNDVRGAFSVVWPDQAL